MNSEMVPRRWGGTRYSPAIKQQMFEGYLDSVASLSSKEGKTLRAKWTNATLLLFIAQPDRFMFSKVERQHGASRVEVWIGHVCSISHFGGAKALTT